MFHLDKRSLRDLRDLVSDLQDVTDDLEHDLDARWVDTVADVARDAQILAPQRTGRLRNSIDSGMDGRGNHIVFAGVEYAVIQNYGGLHPVFGNQNVQVVQEGHHFMNKALDRNESQVMEDASDSTSHAFRKAGFL